MENPEVTGPYVSLQINLGNTDKGVPVVQFQGIRVTPSPAGDGVEELNHHEVILLALRSVEVVHQQASAELKVGTGAIIPARASKVMHG